MNAIARVRSIPRDRPLTARAQDITETGPFSASQAGLPPSRTRLKPRTHRTLVRLLGTAVAIVGAGVLAVLPAQAAQPIAQAVGTDAELTVADIRAVRDEFADVTQALKAQERDLSSLLAGPDEWLAGVTGNDPGTGLPWVDVVSRQLEEGQADIRRMRAKSGDIGESITRALTSLRKDNSSGAFRIMRTVATDLNRLTQDAASSGDNITMTLGSARSLLENLGNGGGLQRIATSVQLQSGLMRDLRQTETVVPPRVFPDVIRGDVEPEQIKQARQSFRQVTAALDTQLETITHLVSSHSSWGQGTETIDPGTGQPWGLVLGQQVKASRVDISRLQLRADGIGESLSRAFRSAQQDNEGGIRLALRSATRGLQQLSRDAQGTGNNLTMTLTATRPLLEAVGDGEGLRRITECLTLQGSLLNRIEQSQRSVTDSW